MRSRTLLKQRRQQAARRQQTGLIAGVSVVAIAIVGFLIYQNTRPIGEIIPIEKETWPLADGKALGNANARILIQEFSDFQ
jgi:hypothetical protein